MIQNVEYLNRYPSSHVRIEGNTDERGTNEYNVALGQRRAFNTMQYMIKHPEKMKLAGEKSQQVMTQHTPESAAKFLVDVTASVSQ